MVRAPSDHPRAFRRSILATALVAMATWWGLGLPYSLFAWILDPRQLDWVLVCYAWEVPVAGLLGPVAFPLLWFRDIERRWDATFRVDASADPAATAALVAAILDFPIRVAWVFLFTSLIGYGFGAVQLALFAQTPVTELAKIVALGLATGLIGGLFAFLYLESLLAPLVQRIATAAPVVPPAARRVPLFVKVFACSLIMTLTALLLLGTIFYSRGERVLEEEIGRRALGEARQLANELAGREELPRDRTWWRERAARMRLGRSGAVYVVEPDGTVAAGDTTDRRIEDEGFRGSVDAAVLSAEADVLVDRVWVQRIVAAVRVGGSRRRVVAVVRRADFGAELEGMLRRGAVVFLVSLVLALVQGFLFSRRLSRPIEVLTDMAGRISHAPHGPWQIVPVRTNDEVGELATAFNEMIARLEGARTELERRVAEATRNISTLYEVARTTTSTLEIEDVLELVAEKVLATLGLRRLVLLWHPPDLEDVVDAYAATAGGRGERLEIEEPPDLARLCAGSPQPEIVSPPVDGGLPSGVAPWLGAPRTLSLPLVFKDRLLGVILAPLDGDAAEPDLTLAAALASQAAAALANAGLFETVRRTEAELRKLSEMRADLQEESMRRLSRELHDGVAQVLTVVNMDLGMIERKPQLDPAALRARLHEAREQLTSLLQDVRTMSQVLRPSMLDFGLVPTLHWYVERFMERTQIAVAVQTPPEETRLPAEIELMLYRVAQEALTNVAKHARARHVELELRASAAEVVLIVADDGVGFEVGPFRRRQALGGVGLLGMRERVAYYHGSLDIRSGPRAGVRITIRVPLPGGTAARPAQPGRLAP